jgi:hypothetical protein
MVRRRFIFQSRRFIRQDLRTRPICSDPFPRASRAITDPQFAIVVPSLSLVVREHDFRNSGGKFGLPSYAVHARTFPVGNTSMHRHPPLLLAKRAFNRLGVIVFGRAR